MDVGVGMCGCVWMWVCLGMGMCGWVGVCGCGCLCVWVCGCGFIQICPHVLLMHECSAIHQSISSTFSLVSSAACVPLQSLF